MIAKLCPNGVKFKKLEEITVYERPDKYIVKSTEYKDGYTIPVLTAGDSFILGYTNETDGVYQATKDNPVIIFDDFTTSFHWVDFPFKVKSSAMKMIKPTNGISFRYVYYAMKCIQYTPSSHARQWISTYQKFTIPVPPLEVQEEIVRILDKFTELEAELEAELENRKKQYNYYQDELLTFINDVPIVPLGTIGTNLDFKRKPVTKNVRESGEYPYYGASGIVDYVKDYLFYGDFLLISEDGANLLARTTPIAFSASGKIWVNNHAHVLQFKTYATRRYIELYINSIDLSRYISTAAQPKLNQENLNKITIPLPSIEEQERIVAILDKFDVLVKDLSVGLPAEINARRQQYEYYRNKLLTFKEAVQ